MPDQEIDTKPLVQCPHCHQMVRDVFEHTANEECEVINQQIGDFITGRGASAAS